MERAPQKGLKSASQPAYRLRMMRLTDLPAVLAIERVSFPDPWSESVFREELQQNSLAHYLVLEIENQLIGYCGFWLVANEVQITKIAVAASHRGHGWGQKLMEHVMTVSKSLGAKKATLEVRVSNRTAQHLYEKLGFASAGIRPRFYTTVPEDAVIMWVDIR